MTADMLENDLTLEIKFVFSGYQLKNSIGNRVPLNVYTQDLPMREGAEDEDPPEPYILIKVLSGNIPSENAAHTVTVIIVIGVYDDDSSRQGRKDVLHIIQRIYERFAKKPLLAGRHELKYPIDWVINDDDTYPYYFGGLKLQFEIYAIEKEDPLA